MTRIGFYDPATAKMILQVVNYLRQNGFVIPQNSQDTNRRFVPEPIYFRNDSGEDCPPWGCMEVTGTVESGSQNYVTITKPTTSARTYLFNGPAEVENGGYGMAQLGPVLRGYKSSGTITEGLAASPTTGQWYLTLGVGGYMQLGADDIASNVVRVIFNDNRLIHVKTKATCAARNDSTGAMTSVSCDRYNVFPDGTVSDAGYDITVWNPGGSIASGAWGTVLLNESGQYEFVVVKCA